MNVNCNWISSYVAHETPCDVFMQVFSLPITGALTMHLYHGFKTKYHKAVMCILLINSLHSQPNILLKCRLLSICIVNANCYHICPCCALKTPSNFFYASIFAPVSAWCQVCVGVAPCSPYKRGMFKSFYDYHAFFLLLICILVADTAPHSICPCLHLYDGCC